MAVEQLTPESPEEQVTRLLSRLRTLQVTYWLPGLGVEDKAEVENEVDVICEALVAQGVDLEALNLHDTITE